MPAERQHTPWPGDAAPAVSAGDGVRRWLAAARGVSLGLLFATGCGTTKNVENPVVGPRPPRSEEMLAQLEDSARRGGAIRQAAAADDGETSRTGIVPVSATVNVIRDEDLAARVNGHPIFVAEVLERYRPSLEAQRGQMTPQAYHQARRDLIQKELPGFIEQTLVIDAVRKKFKQDKWDELQNRLDAFFYEHEVPDLQKRLGVQSLQEVEAEMQKAGTTLSAYRRIWGNRQLAAQWVREQMPEPTVSRQELVAAYESRLDQFREPAQVKWQECWIANLQSGGRDGARKRVQQAVEDLKSGMSFDEVIAKHSDGAQTHAGGHWDWANPDSLADEALRQALMQLELNQIGPVIESERGFRLVKLTGRREERVKSFEDVQQELRESLLQSKREASAKQLIDKLRASAHIETIFDEGGPPS